MSKTPFENFPSFSELALPGKEPTPANQGEMVLILSSRHICSSLNDLDQCMHMDQMDLPKISVDDPE